MVKPQLPITTVVTPLFGEGVAAVPGELGVEVRVQIDDARGHHLPVRVHACMGSAEILAHGGDSPAFDRDPTFLRRAAKAVDDLSIFDHKIVHGSPPRCAVFALQYVLFDTNGSM